MNEARRDAQDREDCPGHGALVDALDQSDHRALSDQPDYKVHPDCRACPDHKE